MVAKKRNKTQITLEESLSRMRRFKDINGEPIVAPYTEPGLIKDNKPHKNLETSVLYVTQTEIKNDQLTGFDAWDIKLEALDFYLKSPVAIMKRAEWDDDELIDNFIYASNNFSNFELPNDLLPIHYTFSLKEPRDKNSIHRWESIYKNHSALITGNPKDFWNYNTKKRNTPNRRSKTNAKISPLEYMTPNEFDDFYKKLQDADPGYWNFSESK